MITTVIAVREDAPIHQFLELNPFITKFPIIVVDSGGGEILRDVATEYIKETLPLSKARRTGILRVKTHYTLILDVDTVLPPEYITEALKILREENIAVTALDYEQLQGHLGFGTSLWKTQILKNLYDWEEGKICECVWMWSKVRKAGYRLETLPYRARHLK